MRGKEESVNQVWKPEKHVVWKDYEYFEGLEHQKHGQKEDILCVAQCPPLLLATSSYDGEIIIWNVISGHVHCKLNTPSPSDGSQVLTLPMATPPPFFMALSLRWPGQKRFLPHLPEDSREANLESAATALMANGPRAQPGPALKLQACRHRSRDKAWVSSMAVTTGDACAYVSDQDGFVHVHDIEEYDLQGPEPQPSKSR
ncbi:hypothetical protein J1605_007204 [Eschrichtius robustus]|uniref:WD repeat-containing protein 49 n=1 Tax=Eschrichtius robustus TaxID=9764 RepID=A0AB34H2E6_ESCRO|nr:hypothetical protein J1605_007204 [Eschrichtius robustus]